MKPRLLIIGASGHDRSVAEGGYASGAFNVVGFLDDAFPGTGVVWNIPLLGRVSDWRQFAAHADWWFVAIGHNGLRLAITCLLTEADMRLATVFYPRRSFLLAR